MAKTKTPYKDASVLIRDIESFLSKHSSLFRSQGTRISHFFEMSCYNYVVKFYETNGFKVVPQNLQRGIFRYKISAVGNPENFSHFLVTKKVKENLYEFEIHHNLSIECAHEKDIFYTADISVIKKDSIERINPPTYSVKRSCCKSINLETFFEVKHLSPFPELLFSFTGIPDSFLTKDPRSKVVLHLAPSLLMSGRANFHSERIKKYLENRYGINIILNLFGTPSAVYSKKYLKQKIGTLITPNPAVGN
jgi:hypothetical protein